ncbi:MAG: hypothetical protein IJ110_01450 [Lachnospiraceae bacterium]|nr:hypothetical protein [Lachnospiraceae bacterium]
MENIIVGLISGLITLAVCLINNHYQRIAADKQHSETIALIEYRLNELTRQVEKHNQVLERTALLEEKMRSANHRLDDLEKR